MIVYADKYKIYNTPHKAYEYEVLNELKDLSSRMDMNCLKHTRFLFEMDNTTLEEQKAMAEQLKDKLVRVTFSGKKSLHCIIEFNPSFENYCKEHYKQIWKFIDRTYFGGKSDNKCSNPARLTRRPGAIRKDTGKEQKLLLNQPNNYFPIELQELQRGVKEILVMEQLKQTINRSLNAKQTHFTVEDEYDPNGKALKKDNVVYYLNTPFLQTSGNGNSDSSLFSALSTCSKMNDQQTLDAVISKAKAEGWTDREIEHKLDCINKNK